MRLKRSFVASAMLSHTFSPVFRRSHVCWHVYGLLHRSDRNYNEAIKAYKQALRIDPENLQILRDLSLLQIQMRDLAGFVVTRHTLLTLKSNAKINWISFALAKHLTGDLRGAISVIDTYIGTLTEGSSELERGFESSELAMYRNTVLAEIPDNYEEAIAHLSECEDLVMDRAAWLMTRAKYQLQLGQFEDARKTFLALFERGACDDYKVHSGYMCALLELDPKTCKESLNLNGMDTVATIMKLTDAQKLTLLEAYRGELFALMPKSPTVQRIPLTLLEGEEFRAAMDAYCRKSLRKGVPSLCSDLSSFLVVEENGRYRRINDPVEVKGSPVYVTFVEMADAYIDSLEANVKFSVNDEKEESPSTILWAWFLRAGLYELAGEYEAGIALLDKCLEHTPTAVDVYELKARLLRSSGDINAAVECLDTGRELDKQDRYINNQTTKYMLHAGMLDTALERIALFTRHEGNPEQNLYDMQCSWYELDLASALERKEEWGRSLKKYGALLHWYSAWMDSFSKLISRCHLCLVYRAAAVVKHFEDFHEDQFDFHSYCVRKVTLRAYLDVLRYEDHIWGEEYYRRAAESIIRIYLHLYDNPSIAAGEQEPDYSKMTAAQKKKAKAVARKKKKAAEKKAEETAEKQKELEAKENGNKAKKGTSEAEKDTDPDGKELMLKDPLEEANKYSVMLAAHAPGQLSTWMLRYDVAIRRGKALIAMQVCFFINYIGLYHFDVINQLTKTFVVPHIGFVQVSCHRCTK